MSQSHNQGLQKSSLQWSPQSPGPSNAVSSINASIPYTNALNSNAESNQEEEERQQKPENWFYRQIRKLQRKILKDSKYHDNREKKMRAAHIKECDDIRQTTREECEKEYNNRLEEMKTEYTKECDNIRQITEECEKEYNNRLEEMKTEHTKECNEIRQTTKEECEKENDNRLKGMKAKHQKECAYIWQMVEAYKNRLEEMKAKYENEKIQGSPLESQDIRRDTKLHAKLTANESEMYERILELEEQLRRERSLRPQSHGSNAGLFEMDGANPDTFNQTWFKLYDSINQSVENMLKQKVLQADNIRDWCYKLINSAIPANSITRLSKPVQKRIIEHCITSALATIWEIAVLGELTVKHRPADGIFEMDTTLSELESLAQSQIKKSEIAFLVTRMKSEFAKLLLNVLPKPLDIEKILNENENVNFNPFSCLPMRIREQISEFYNRKFDAVIQVLGRFGDENTIMQSKSSILFLVYTSIHVRLQMEAMQSGMVAVFAGTTCDCQAMNIIQALNVVQLQKDQHNAITSLNPPTKSKQYEADHAVLLTIFPGVANVKMNDGRIMINDKMQKLCKVLSY